jgi:hypothetical protein
MVNTNFVHANAILAAAAKKTLERRMEAIAQAKFGADVAWRGWRTDRRTGADVPTFYAPTRETADAMNAAGLETIHVG